MVHARNFDEQNFDKLIVGFIGKALTGKGWKVGRENFDESLAIRQSFALYGTYIECRGTPGSQLCGSFGPCLDYMMPGGSSHHWPGIFSAFNSLDDFND